jgi:hypothetical protein
MTNHCLLTASENGCHKAGAIARRAVTHHVDALVDAVKKAALHSPGDPVLPDSDGVQLRNRDYPMLPRGKFRHGQIEPVALFPHVGE